METMKSLQEKITLLEDIINSKASTRHLRDERRKLISVGARLVEAEDLIKQLRWRLEAHGCTAGADCPQCSLHSELGKFIQREKEYREEYEEFDRTRKEKGKQTIRSKMGHDVGEADLPGKQLVNSSEDNL